jgi:hypothetical protein
LKTSDLKTEELVEKMKDLAKIADELPEKYREKTFEVLLKDFLWGLRETERTVSKTEGPELAVKAVAPQKFIVPISVRALLQQYEIPEETIQKLFVIDGEQIQSKYKIETTVKSDAQIQLALLTALENALKPGGKFEFSMEAARQRCVDHRVYDQPNFKTIFKNKSKFFKSLKDEEHVELSVDGKAELAEAILAVTK